jgi:predicted nucleic acid-binding protein
MQDEPAAARIQAILDQAEAGTVGVRMSVVNAGEVYYQLVRAVGPSSADDVWDDLTRGTMPLRLAAATTPRVKRAAAIKARYPLAYADAFAVGLAAELGWPLATGDPEIRRPAADGVVRLEWLGPQTPAS